MRKIFTKIFRPHSKWNSVPAAPADPILGIAVAFQNCKDPKKVNLGVGAYRDDNGKPFVLDCVRQASKIIHEKNMDNEYLPIQGLQSFSEKAVGLIYGEDFKGLKEKRVAYLQCLSGTGGVRMAFEFVTRFLGKENITIHIPTPSWPSHKNICTLLDVNYRLYNYYDRNTFGLDFEGLKKDINEHMKPGDVILLHTCAHNPTGVDPTREQWLEIRDLVESKGLIAFFDNAYQGFTSGDLEKDADSIRLFLERESTIPILCAQSFAKNFGLYGQRVGCFSVVCSNQDEADRVLSQLKILARMNYSNPPVHGARIVDTVLGNPSLYNLWLDEIKIMSSRIHDMRWALRNHLEEMGSTRNWQHITDQKGMFAYTGMTEEQVLKIRSDHHIYMTNDGRISVAGLNTKNVQYVAEAIHKVTQ